MATDLLKLLKSCKIFSMLDDAALSQILQQAEEVHLKKNDVIYKQGDFSNNLYLVISGKIASFISTEKIKRKLLHELVPGDLFGELTALSHEARTTTTIAVKPSRLLKLTSADFITLCEKFPEVSLELVNTTLALSRTILKMVSENAGRQHIAIIPAKKSVDLKIVHEGLLQQAKHHKDITFLSDLDETCNAPTTELQKKINELDSKNITLVYLIHSYDSNLAKAFFDLEIIDMIYVVATNSKQPALSKAARSKLSIHKYKIIPELILLHEEKNAEPKDTAKWLKLARFNLHHHVRIHDEKDWQRLFRFISGKAIGVVLGGGGLRCWAELGALLAMEKLNIPVDAIGGTSAGAIVAAYYAMKRSFEHSHDLRELADVTNKSIAIKNLSWPSASIFNGKDYTKKLQSIFGNTRIENLWIPCFTVSTNLSSNKSVTCRQGFLWKLIRASTSVPLIFPPVVINGSLRIDGGLLNNMPVDVMKNLLPPGSKIIAVELTHLDEDTSKYNFPPVLPFWQTALTKAGIAHKDYKFPHFIDMFLKSFLAGASAKQEENASRADVLVTPDLASFHLLNITTKEENALIRIGYKTAMKELKKKKIPR